MSAIGNPIATHDDDQSHDPIWNLEEWKDLRRDLNYQPTDNRVRDGNLVDIPSFQLGEERTLFRSSRCWEIHFCEQRFVAWIIAQAAQERVN